MANETETVRRAAIVTGGARGIGRAIAERLARDGVRVAVADLDEAGAASVAAGIAAAGGEAVGLPVDVKDRAAVEEMVKAELTAFGRLDIMVSNAGIMDRCAFLEMTEDFWHRVLDTNLTGTFLCGQVAANAMIASGAAGRIVNVASNSGYFGGRGRGAYGASKAGLMNLTQTMAIELAEHGILVNAVAPGPTKTGDHIPDELWPGVKARMPLARYGRPEEIAAVAAFLASADCSFVTGHIYAADGGYTAAGIMES